MPVNTRKLNPLPDQNDPVVDRQRRFTPTWFRWLRPLLETTADLKLNLKATADAVAENTASIRTETEVRASADEAFASLLTTVQAEVGTNTASITSLSETVATTTGAIATQLDTVSTTVSGNTASITQLSQSIDGIEANYTISINQNGRVVGYTRLDAGVSGSQFSVLADRFKIVHPTNNGVEVEAFVAGLDGSGNPIVGINGTLVVGVIESLNGKMVIDLTNGTIDITA